MRELTDLELDAVSGGDIVKGNGGVAINNEVHQSISQHAEVEDSHNVTVVQAASQSNSISVNPMSMHMPSPPPPPPPGGGPR
jgi:hypothetical protein